MKINKFFKNNWVAVIITLIVIASIGFGTGLFSIIVGQEKSFYVGDMISGTIGFTGSARGPSNDDGKYSIEIKQIDGTWREVVIDEYQEDLRITFTRSYPNICNDVYKNYGTSIACDSPGKWGFRPKISIGNNRYECPLENFVEPGCYSYIPRLREAYAYYDRFAEGIAVDFVANDVQSDGNIIYKTTVVSSSSGGSFDVTAVRNWSLVPNPNPKQCTPDVYDADLQAEKYRVCDENGYWMEYIICADNEELKVNTNVFSGNTFSCEVIVVEEQPIDEQPVEEPIVNDSFLSKINFDYTNNPVGAGVTTGAIVLVVILGIIFIPFGGKKK